MAEQRKSIDGDPHNSFEDSGVGIGQMADGKFDVFPASDLAKRTAEREADDEAIAHAMKRSDEGFSPTVDEEQPEDFADLEDDE